MTVLVAHRPGDDAYELLRQAPFAPIDPHPEMIVEAADTTDVRAAVEAARGSGIPLAVQATGHGTRVPADGALLLRTTRMAGVTVDPERRIARVGPGARWGAVLAAAAPYGLAPLSGSHAGVGVTGYTLGGGMGWLARKHGLAAGSVLRAQVVTAGGDVVTASPDSHPDLFWALCGGGGGFGVVTSLEFRLYPVRRVLAGTVRLPIELAAPTLARYRTWIEGAPPELSTAVVLTRLPDGRRVVEIKAMYAADDDGAGVRARRLLRPLLAGPVLGGGLRLTGYARADLGGTAPAHLDLLRDLPDPVIEALVSASTRASVEVRHWGGAIPDAGSACHQDAPLSVVADAALPALADALRPHATGRSFLNFLHDPAAVTTAFTPTAWRRLREIRNAYDPERVFRSPGA
jgi:FAD/FMN-containing dehydrogenase